MGEPDDDAKTAKLAAGGAPPRPGEAEGARVMGKVGLWRRCLFGLSGWLPCRCIGRDGPYLERYFLFRVPRWVPLVGGWQGYLHRFLDSDSDEGLHDHPWYLAISLLLAGRYIEERMQNLVTGVRVRRTGSVAVIRATDFHRVVMPDDQREAWTLFLHGPYRKRWGFLKRQVLGGGTEERQLLTWVPFAGVAGGGVPWWRKTPRGRRQPLRVSIHG